MSRYVMRMKEELLNVMNKINHQILCILLDYIYIYIYMSFSKSVDFYGLKSKNIGHKMNISSKHREEG